MAFFFLLPFFLLQEKERMGKRKNVSLTLDFFFRKRTRTLRWANALSVLGKKEHGEKEPLMKSEGFLSIISAHYRSHPLALALRGHSLVTLDEAKRKSKQTLLFFVIPNRCAHR